MVVPHLAGQTVGFVDEYCEAYRNLFSDVCSFECFKYLHVGLISEIPRKSLLAIAQIVGCKDGFAPQSGRWHQTPGRDCQLCPNRGPLHIGFTHANLRFDYFFQ